MSLRGEARKIYWSFRSFTDFKRPICAVYGPFVTGNLGDEAALYTASDLLGLELKVISSQTYRRIPLNLRFLYCGLGGCFNGDTPYQMLKFLRRIKDKINFPLVMLSGGINRDYDQRDYEKHYPAFIELLEHFDYVSVRDRKTARMLEGFGIKDFDIIPDLVMCMNPGIRSVDTAQQDKRTIGLILATHTGVVQKKYGLIFEELAAVARQLVRNGYRVVCIPFQQDIFSDPRKVIDEVSSAYDFVEKYSLGDSVAVLDHKMTPHKTLLFLKNEISHIISMRLHGNVMAARLGIPFLPLSYNDKIDAFLEMLDIEDRIVRMDKDDFSAESILKRFYDTDKNYSEENKRLVLMQERIQREIVDRIADIKRKI